MIRTRRSTTPGIWEPADTQSLMRCEKCDAKDAALDLLQEGRRLHDELADHLEHKLAAQSALLAQAAAALELVQKENERARREFTNVSNNLISDAIDSALATIRKEQP
jgi:hypothetical protein